MPRVVLAMSGGVDSSVAAHLLLEQGHEVIGIFMRHGESPVAEERENAPLASLPLLDGPGANRQGCCSAADADDARRVADRLEIPFYAVNFREEFGRIIEYFVSEYAAGRTPNPCVVCNHWLKFGKLFHYADSVGAEFVATGHYARRLPGETPADAFLCRGVDREKDQSYVLFGVDRRLLPRILLPVGEYRKRDIRALAAQLGLRVADKRDSQDICFVASGRHREFVRARRGAGDFSGEIVTTDGRVVGRHPGVERFTVGQRKGLGVALGERHFVVGIEPGARRVVIGPRDQLARRELTAKDVNWLIDRPLKPFPCSAQIRYNSPAAPAVAEPLPDGRLRVRLQEPGYGVAPGQAVVCYQGQRVLVGGWIE